MIQNKLFSENSVFSLLLSLSLSLQVVNGLMGRADWQRAIKTPIGMLPTGSGNSLAKAVLNEAE